VSRASAAARRPTVTAAECSRQGAKDKRWKHGNISNNRPRSQRSPTKEHGMSATPAASATHTTDDERDLATTIANYPPHEAVAALVGEEDRRCQMLERMNPGTAIAILREFRSRGATAIVAQAAPECARQWSVNQAFPEDTIGR